MNNTHENILKKLDYFYENKTVPHIIFHGPSGAGKKTILFNFLNKIYKNDKNIIKTNIMWVNCSHGKGIKFIRDELKYFAKTNIQYNDVLFKSIVLLNADFLTIDAQSALRRCIEVFSYNTRFFIVVQNKQKLLNPILSRFCDIYIPEIIINGENVNLHQYYIKENYKNFNFINNTVIINNKEPIDNVIKKILLNNIVYSQKNLLFISNELYENGISALDIINYINIGENKLHNKITDKQKTHINIEYNKIKSVFRNERNLLLFILNKIYLYINNGNKN